MKHWLPGILFFITSFAVQAQSLPEFPQLPAQDRISFQLASKKWVSTTSALLTVEINATLSGGSIVKMRQEMMSRLMEIARGDWHVTRFERTLDNSGLEKLLVQAEIRVKEDALINIQNDAKKVSKPGMNYSIVSVEFKPDLIDMQMAREALRQELYGKVNAEIARINAAFAEQHFMVSRLEFVEGSGIVQPVAEQKMTALAAESQAMQPVTVSNELVLTAYVEVAHLRKQEK